MTNTIHPNTRIGQVSLTVGDLKRSLDFYQSVLGLSIHHRENGRALLGAGGPDLLELLEQPGARQVPGRTGLYHFAVLVPSRTQLAFSLKNILETQTPVQGFADHLVSEAIYLPDPDGNGIEIYRDRPRDQWRQEDGRLRMATDPLDLDGLLAELEGHDEPWSGLHPKTVIGHIHLHVRDIPEAESFYRDVLGFDLMLRYGPSAAFLSAGGYHHHLGVNTWAGVGAPPPPQDAVGLRWYEIRLPTQAELDGVANQARQAGYSLEEREEGLFLRDPSGNGVLLGVDASEVV
ncbi:MAG: VOC family protein [Anaerolineales bacterium]|nr:VOC family protein [Anaerolineales bacterium]